MLIKVILLIKKMHHLELLNLKEKYDFNSEYLIYKGV